MNKTNQQAHGIRANNPSRPQDSRNTRLGWILVKYPRTWSGQENKKVLPTLQSFSAKDDDTRSEILRRKKGKGSNRSSGTG